MATNAEYQQFMDKTLTCLAGGDFANINFEQYDFNAAQAKSVTSLKKLQSRFTDIVGQNQLFAKEEMTTRFTTPSMTTCRCNKPW